MLQCTTCGTEGELNFSKNELGDLICNLCGTQSFLQNRNETQELDDIGGSASMAGLSAIRTRKRRYEKVTDDAAVEKLHLRDFLYTTQLILLKMASGLVENCNCRPIVVRYIHEIWIVFLKRWAVAGKRDLMDCFTHLVDYRLGGDRVDKRPERTEEGTHSRQPRTLEEGLEFRFFTYNHLLSMCYLGCLRACNGVLPCDLVQWVHNGQIPYYRVFFTLPQALQDKLGVFSCFFTRNNLPSNIKVIAFAHYLKLHLKLKFPPMNIPLVAHRLIQMYQMPQKIFEYFCRLTGYIEPRIGKIHPTIVHLDTQLGIISTLACAIRLYPSWHFWIHKIDHDVFRMPWHKADQDKMLRKHLPKYLDFCRTQVYYQDQTPSALVDHLNDLERFCSFERPPVDSEARLNPIVKFWPGYHDGTLIHQDVPPSYPENVFFYPTYWVSNNGANFGYHGALEAMVLRLCKHIDAHPSLVMRYVHEFDRDLSFSDYRGQIKGY